MVNAISHYNGFGHLVQTTNDNNVDLGKENETLEKNYRGSKIEVIAHLKRTHKCLVSLNESPFSFHKKLDNLVI